MAKKDYTKVILFTSIFLLIIGILFNPFLQVADKAINAWIPSIQAAFLVFLSKFIGIVFDTAFLFVFSAIIVVYLWKTNKKTDSAHFAFTMVIGGLLSFAIKTIVARTRPINALVSTIDYSFPSGHTMSAVIFFGLIIYLICKHRKTYAGNWKLDVFCIKIPIIIGFSRLYLNVHWLSDVLGGMLIGLIILTSSLLIAKRKEWSK